LFATVAFENAGASLSATVDKVTNAPGEVKSAGGEGEAEAAQATQASRVKTLLEVSVATLAELTVAPATSMINIFSMTHEEM
jgi:hypothetical protein